MGTWDALVCSLLLSTWHVYLRVHLPPYELIREKYRLSGLVAQLCSLWT